MSSARYAEEPSGENIPQSKDADKPKYSTAPETKDAATEGELELPEGYQTESGKPLHESNSHEFIVDENGNIHATNGGIVGKMVGSVITWYQNALNGRTILPKNIRCPTSLTHKKFARLIIEGGLFFVFYKPSH